MRSEYATPYPSSASLRSAPSPTRGEGTYECRAAVISTEKDLSSTGVYDSRAAVFPTEKVPSSTGDYDCRAAVIPTKKVPSPLVGEGGAKRRMRGAFIIICSLFLCFFTQAAFAVTDFYEFANDKEKQRFQFLTSELRCLVCQNQNLAESNAPLAEDLRNQIYQQVQQGHDNKTIIHYLVTRYGDFILYRPPLNTQTLILWLGPFGFLIFIVGYLFFELRRRI